MSWSESLLFGAPKNCSAVSNRIRPQTEGAKGGNRGEEAISRGAFVCSERGALVRDICIPPFRRQIYCSAHPLCYQQSQTHPEAWDWSQKVPLLHSNNSGSRETEGKSWRSPLEVCHQICDTENPRESQGKPYARLTDWHQYRLPILQNTVPKQPCWLWASATATLSDRRAPCAGCRFGQRAAHHVASPGHHRQKADRQVSPGTSTLGVSVTCKSEGECLIRHLVSIHICIYMKRKITENIYE